MRDDAQPTPKAINRILTFGRAVGLEGCPVPSERPSRELQRPSVMIPVEQRVCLQQIADKRFISLSDTIREAVREKIERERDEATHGR